MAASHFVGAQGRIVHDCQWPDCVAVADYTTARGVSRNASTPKLYVCERHMLAFRELTDAEAADIGARRQPRRGRVVATGWVSGSEYVERHGDD